MSYCRWSSDHGECDVYVYEDVSGGWTTHVAGRRLRERLPDAIKALDPYSLEYSRARDAWRRTLKGTEYEVKAYPKGTAKLWDIDDSEYLSLSEIGPEAGESYNDPTPGECAFRLRALKAKGFNVPDYAIEELEEEEG